MKKRILAINPGSTSTKIALYEDQTPLFVQSIDHSKEEIGPFQEIFDQYNMRKNIILEVLNKKGIEMSTIVAVVARGGLLPPVQSGAYEVNEDMVYQLKYYPQNEHASNLGAPIAKALADEWQIPAYVYDPVTVDELEPIARVTGLPEMERKGMGHNLNMRATAIRYANELNIPYKELTVIVAHLGGGITLSLHNNGKMIDMISDDEGPFSPERSGGLPIFQVIKMATSGEYTYKTMMKKIKNNAGLSAYLGTKDAREVEKLAEAGDEKAKFVYEAMAYNIAKNIGKLAVVVNGKVDAILLTGGMAYSPMLIEWISDRVSFIAPVKIYAGENEMESLALGALRVLNGEEEVHQFVKVCN